MKDEGERKGKQRQQRGGEREEKREREEGESSHDVVNG